MKISLNTLKTITAFVAIITLGIVGYTCHINIDKKTSKNINSELIIAEKLGNNNKGVANK